MAKTRQIFIWNGSEDLGPFRREELIDQLRGGAVSPNDYYFEEGMSDWRLVAALPCCRTVLATEAQKQMLDSMGIEYGEFLTKAEVSEIIDHQPATERQLALLKYLGVHIPDNLTKTHASEVLGDCKQDPNLAERFWNWNRDRLDVQPALYAAERATFKASRASTLLEEYNAFRAEIRPSRFPRLTIEQIDKFVLRLDQQAPGWDRDIKLGNGLDFVLKWIEQ